MYIYIYNWVRFKAPSMFISKRSSKFETLLAKIFRLRTKTKIKYIELLQKKLKLLFSKKTVYCSNYKITMRECKTKDIQTNFGTFNHKRKYPGIIQAYSGMSRTLYQPGIFKTVAYPEPLHIQNSGIFTTLVYSEARDIQNIGIFKI